MSGLATLRVFYDLPQAQVARSILCANGIPAFLPDGYLAANNWGFIVALGGIRLVVPERNVERANALLDAPSPRGEAGDPVDACPACGGEDVFRQPSLFAAVTAFLFVQWPFLIMTRRRRCRTCDHRWRTTG